MPSVVLHNNDSSNYRFALWFSYLDQRARAFGLEQPIFVSYDKRVQAMPDLCYALCQEYIPRQQPPPVSCVVEILQIDFASSSLQEAREFFAGLEKIGQALGQLTSLRSLTFRREWDASVPPEHMLADLRCEASIMKHVRQISHLEQDLFESINMRHYAAALTGHAGLEKIFLRKLVADHEQCLSRALLSLPKLRELSSSLKYFHPNLLQALLFKQMSLILYGHALSLEQWTALCQALGSSRSRLTTLILERFELPFTAMNETSSAELLAHSLLTNISLRSLKIRLYYQQSTFRQNSNTPIIVLDHTTGDLLGRAVGQHPNLNELDLSFPDGMYDQEVGQWAKLLTGLSASRTLDKLTLHAFPFGGEEAIVNALKEIMQHVNLTELHLSHLSLSESDKWDKIFGCISFSRSLLKLSMEGTMTLSKGEIGRPLSAMSKLIKACTSLETVDVSFPSIRCSRSEVIDFINSIVPIASKLCSLILQFTMQGDLSWTTLLKVIQNNYGLVNFTAYGLTHRQSPYSSNFLCQKQVDLLGCISAMNKAGRCYVLQDPTNKMRSILVLSAVRNCLHSLFLHLCENPFICKHTQLTEASSGRYDPMEMDH